MEENKTMTIAECQVETQKHIEKVREYIRLVSDKLATRAVEHDRLKLESPEVEIFYRIHTKTRKFEIRK